MLAGCEVVNDEEEFFLSENILRFLGSIVVSIAVCHMADRGSIPRLGVLFVFLFSLFLHNFL